MDKFKIQKGMFLVISMLLTSVLTATGIVLIKVTTTGKQVSDTYIQNTQLLNSATISAGVIDQAIDAVINQLDVAEANTYLVDTSVTPKVIVRDASANAATISNANLAQQLFGTSTTGNPNTMTLNAVPGKQGNFSLTYKKLSINPLNTSEALYNLKISASVCNQTGSCQKTDKQVIKKRSCPPGTPSNKSMRPLLDSELPTSYSNAFPNLYCTCSDPGFSKTTAAGDCVAAPCPDGYYNSPPPNGSTCASCSSGSYCTGGIQYPCTTSNCQTCTATTCSVCNPNYYLFNSSTCNACPTANVASCSSSGSFTCNVGYYKNGPTATSCTACTSIVGVVGCDANGNSTSCSSGYGLVSGSCNPCLPGTYSSGGSGGCINCSSGYYTAGFSSTSCNTPCTSIPGVANCTTNGTVTACNAGYGLVNGVCNQCSSGTYSTGGTSGCNSCMFAGVTSCNSTNGQANGCNAGYGLVNGVCNQCSSGTYSTGGTSGCNSCMSTGVASCNSTNGQVTSCSSGYNLSNGNCVAGGGSSCIATAGCQGGSSYMTGGYGAYLTTTPLCYCPSSISVWDLKTCRCININSCTSGFATVEYPTDNNPSMNTSHGYYNFTIRIMCSPTCPAGATCYPKP